MVIQHERIRRETRAHVLVAEAFIGPVPPGKEVNHKDGIKEHNCWSNLEYLTHHDNILHAARIGLRRNVHGVPPHKPGEKNGRAKLTDDAVREVRRLRAEGARIRELASRFGVSESAIRFVLSGQHWKHVA